nr:MAG TPA: hypothetical protein [Caudoviricetes sp.]
MTVLKIGTLDVTSFLLDQGFDVEYETLLSSKSGRNARGKNRIEIVARKDKLYCKFRALTSSEIQQFLAAIKSYVFSVTYLNPETGALKTIQVNSGTPKIGYLRINPAVMTKEFDLNFIEL